MRLEQKKQKKDEMSVWREKQLSLKRGKGEKLGMRGEIDLLLLHASKQSTRGGGGWKRSSSI